MKALEQNAAQVGAHRDTTEAAVAMEYRLFLTNKGAQTYKLNHNSKVSLSPSPPPLFPVMIQHLIHQVKEIKSLAEKQILHSSLKDDEPVSLSPTQAPPTGTGDTPLFSGFMKASKLTRSSSSEVVGSISGGGFVSASRLLPDTKPNAATSPPWSCDKTAASCGADGVGSGGDSGAGMGDGESAMMTSQV